MNYADHLMSAINEMCEPTLRRVRETTATRCENCSRIARADDVLCGKCLHDREQQEELRRENGGEWG